MPDSSYADSSEDERERPAPKADLRATDPARLQRQTIVVHDFSGGVGEVISLDPTNLDEVLPDRKDERAVSRRKSQPSKQASKQSSISEHEVTITDMREDGRKRQRKGTLDSMHEEEPRKGIGKRVRGRWVKRKRKVETIGVLITKHDKTFELVFKMLLGIRFAVSKTTAKRFVRDLTRADFAEKTTHPFPSHGTQETIGHPYSSFTFVDYCPFVFRRLRENFSIDSADYLLSLTEEYKLSEIISPGKSGSFFYFSPDTRFMLKTITKAEKQCLRRILFAYYKHVTTNPDTLIIRFFGLHKVKKPRGQGGYYFVIMGNIFAQACGDLHEKYDLKGSSVGRTCGVKRPGAIWKDLDFDRNLTLGPEKRAVFLDQVHRDSEFLERIGIMDYSLLLGIHKITITEEPIGEAGDVIHASPSYSVQESEQENMRMLFNSVFTRDEGGFGATDEDNNPIAELYYMGIIDILQPYSLGKRFEHNFKSLRWDPYEISAVDPTTYARRFVAFLEAHVNTNDAHKLELLPITPPDETVVDKAARKERKHQRRIEAKEKKKKIKEERKRIQENVKEAKKEQREQNKKIKKEEKQRAQKEKEERRRSRLMDSQSDTGGRGGERRSESKQQDGDAFDLLPTDEVTLHMVRRPWEKPTKATIPQGNM